jgi:hypothetical protein
MHHDRRLSSDCAGLQCRWTSCLLSLSALLAVSCWPQASTAAVVPHAKHSGPPHQRHLKLQSSVNPHGSTLFAPPLLPVSNSSAYPFSAVGQLANGCSAFLVSPCHVMTVAHCVVEPHRKIWYPGLEFYPGRWAQATASICTYVHGHPPACAWSPCSASIVAGCVCTACVVLHENQ